jgi:YD repeat-containing protein
VYDAAGQLTGLSALNPGGGYVNRFTYTYDPASRRTLALASDGSRTSYTYDPAGQLTREFRTGPNATNALHLRPRRQPHPAGGLGGADDLDLRRRQPTAARPGSGWPHHLRLRPRRQPQPTRRSLHNGLLQLGCA